MSTNGKALKFRAAKLKGFTVYYKQIKYLIFQIKAQACPMGGRMLTYHTQVTINIPRLLLHNCDYFVSDMC